MVSNGGSDRPFPVHLWHPPHCGDSEMRIAADGQWYHQGELIRRAEMVRLFSRLLRCEPGGGHVLVTPAERLSIIVDDAPFVARVVESDGQGSTRQLHFRLNTGDAVTAGPGHRIHIGDKGQGPRPYLHVRDGLRALLARPVYYDLAGWALAEAADPPGLWSNGVFLPLNGGAS